MNISKLRILGSGFTEEEYHLYRLDLLDSPDEAMRFLSNKHNHETFRPAVNRGQQQHLLEDKWATHLFFSALELPVPRTYGLYHPRFGLTPDGNQLTTAEDFLSAIGTPLPPQLILKPRGGRQGHDIILANLTLQADGQVIVSTDDAQQPLEDFLSSLPHHAFTDYEGCYHGWIIQERIQQHSFMEMINPHTVNTIRIATFITTSDETLVDMAALRLGREGGNADNWDKGGLSVSVALETGRLGHGVFKVAYGGSWHSEHPDTNVRFEGLEVPHWQTIIALCHRAASTLSGIRSVGCDIALTESGPVIIEGNATWSLPLLQVHSHGYLTEPRRAELASLGARFPIKARPLPFALLAMLRYQWRRSRAPNFLKKLLSVVPKPGP